MTLYSFDLFLLLQKSRTSTLKFSVFYSYLIMLLKNKRRRLLGHHANRSVCSRLLGRYSSSFWGLVDTRIITDDPSFGNDPFKTCHIKKTPSLCKSLSEALHLFPKWTTAREFCPKFLLSLLGRATSLRAVQPSASAVQPTWLRRQRLWHFCSSLPR